MAEIGFISFFLPLSGLFIYPIAGQIADRMGRVKVIAISRLLYGASYLFYVFAPNWIFLAIGNFFLGLFIFHYPAESAITADSLSPDQRGIGFAALMAFPNAVSMVGPYVGAFIISIYGVNLGMRFLYAFIMICCIVMCSLFRLKFLKETITTSKSKIRLKNLLALLKHSYKDVWETLKWMPRSLKALALILVISLFFNWIAAPFWVVYAVNVIELTELEWGLLMLVMGGLNVGLSIPAGIIVDRFGGRKTIFGAFILSIISVFFFVFCEIFLQTLIVLLAVSVANAIFMSACPTLLADIVPKEKRGRVLATLGRGQLFILTQGGGGGGPGMGLILTLPMMLSSLISGYIYSFNSFYPWFLLAIGLSLCLILMTLFVREAERPEL